MPVVLNFTDNSRHFIHTELTKHHKYVIKGAYGYWFEPRATIFDIVYDILDDNEKMAIPSRQYKDLIYALIIISDITNEDFILPSRLDNKFHDIFENMLHKHNLYYLDYSTMSDTEIIMAIKNNNKGLPDNDDMVIPHIAHSLQDVLKGIQNTNKNFMESQRTKFYEVFTHSNIRRIKKIFRNRNFDSYKPIIRD